MSDAQSLLNNEAKLYCYGDYKAEVIQATHLNPLLERSSLLPPPLYSAGFNGTVWVTLKKLMIVVYRSVS